MAGVRALEQVVMLDKAQISGLKDFELAVLQLRIDLLKAAADKHEQAALFHVAYLLRNEQVRRFERRSLIS